MLYGSGDLKAGKIIDPNETNENKTAKIAAKLASKELVENGLINF